MKDRMDRSEGIGESKGEGVGASLSDDVIGTKILFRKLLQGMSGLEMFSFEKYLITDFEIWCQRLVFVGSDLVLFWALEIINWSCW